MKPSKWKVYFDEHDSVYIVTTAWNGTEAKILAQAERIKDGLSYKVYNIARMEA